MSDTTGKFQRQTESLTLTEVRVKLRESQVRRQSLYLKLKAEKLWEEALLQRVALLTPPDVWECSCLPDRDMCPACKAHSRAKFGDNIPMTESEL